MLRKDFVLNTVLGCLGEGKSVIEIGEWLGLGDTSLLAIEEVHLTGEKWGQALTGQDIVEIYNTGLTFSEIAWIKGVTKVAIRLTVDSVIGAKKEEAKKVSAAKRKEMRNIIIYKKIVEESERVGRELAQEKSGYSESMFNTLYRESIKWKELRDDEGEESVEEFGQVNE